MGKTIKDALSNRNYVLLVLLFAFMQGMFTAFGTNIDYLLSPPYKTSGISKLGVFIVLSGVISSVCNGIVLRKYKKFLL